VSNWQRIETAPKDRRILLGYADNRVESGYWFDPAYMYIGDSCRPTNIEPIAWQELPVFDGVIG
jgi:hypothetical protein